MVLDSYVEEVAVKVSRREVPLVIGLPIEKVDEFVEAIRNRLKGVLSGVSINSKDVSDVIGFDEAALVDLVESDLILHGLDLSDGEHVRVLHEMRAAWQTLGNDVVHQVLITVPDGEDMGTHSNHPCYNWPTRVRIESS